MTILRISLRVLAILNLLLSGFTALVGSFADGNDIAARLLLTVVHPITAVAIILLVFLPRLNKPTVTTIASLITLSIIADLYYAIMIATGNIKGDWIIPLIFAIIPAISLAYAINQIRQKPQSTVEDEG